jgi:branched-subunit amino acid ABC-type transport system permease component
MTATLLQSLLNGLASGGAYALFALGYTLVFSVLGVINFAQGALFTLGGYLTFLLMGGAIGINGALPGLSLPVALPFWLALILAGGGSALAALGVERVAFAPLRRQGAEPLLYLITSLGAGVVLVNLLQILMGSESYAFPSSALGGWPASLAIGSARVRTVQLLLLVISALLVGVLGVWLERSRSGQALRAVAEDATTAQLLGINSAAMRIPRRGGRRPGGPQREHLRALFRHQLRPQGPGGAGARRAWQCAGGDCRRSAHGHRGGPGARGGVRLPGCPGLWDPLCRAAPAAPGAARPA